MSNMHDKNWYVGMHVFITLYLHVEVLKDESDGNSDQVGENQLTINRAAVNGKE